MTKQFTYTHHQGGEGKMVEKARMEKPECPVDAAMSSVRYSEYVNRCNEYDKHMDSLTTYDALGFSPSANGKTFGEDEFEVKRQWWHNERWLTCNEDWYNKTSESWRRIIAVPLSEKREERTQDELWEEVLNAAGFGFVNRHKFIEALKERYSLTPINKP